MRRGLGRLPADFRLCAVGEYANASVHGEDVGELQLSSDDYLQGVIGMVNELVRAQCGGTFMASLAPSRGTND